MLFRSQILLANALAGLKDLKAAVEEIEEALRLDPQRGSSYTNLGTFELARGRRDAAEVAFKKAVELDPQSAAAQLGLANFYWVDRRFQLAEAALLEAVRLEPDNPMAHRMLANYYLATGRAPEAGPHLQRVLEVSKSPEAALALAEYYIGQKDHSADRKSTRLNSSH